MPRQFIAYSPTAFLSRIAIGLLLSVAMFAVQRADAAPYRAEWPQANSDLQPDPAVKFGALPNGMRYAIMKNNMPEGAVSLRLRMDTGSLQENDAQQGIAHLLEHMAFRGSKQLPDGEVVKTLERIGLQFGADTNAFTSHTQTVYKFDLPRSDDSSVDTGLMLLREIASELNITDDALKTERGVVLSEWRLRNTPQQRADDTELAAMLPGQRAPLRMPIGKPDIIEHADAALVRSYYSAFYRPQRATLIVVGNIDPDALEKKIVARFGNWQAAAEIAPDPDLGVVKPPAQLAKIYAEPGLPTQVSFDWSQPYDDDAATRERVREDVIRTVGLVILNQRFQQAALGDDAPFSSARANYIQNLMHSARCTSIGIDTTPEKWRDALQTVQHTLNGLLTQGVMQDDVQRVVATLRTNLQTAVAGANTRRTPALADTLVSSLDNRDVFLSPQQTYEIAIPTLQNLSAQTVTAVLRHTFAGTQPLLFVASSAPLAGGETAVASAYQDALHGVADDIKQAPIIWPYAEFGAPGEIATRHTADDLGTTFVAFKNGVSAAIKPTKFSAGQLEIAVRVGAGRLALDKRVATSNFLLNALVTGGLDKIDYPTLQKALAGKTYSLNAALSDSYLLLGGRTTPGDLDTQLQVIAAYLTEPALRNGAIEQMRNTILAQLPQLSAQPLSNLMVRVPGMLRDNDPRWRFPTVDEVRNAKADDLKAWLLPMLKQGALQVAIVGDIDVERAIQTLATTVGALNARPAAVLTLSKQHEIAFPAALSVPLALHHSGGPDQAAAFIAWPAPDRRSNLHEAADLQVLAAIMQERLIDTMRSRTGSSYTANVFYEGSWALTGFGALQAVSDIKPAQTNVFYQAVNAIANDLRNKPVAKDEFSRAQQPLLANIDKLRQNNGFFAQVMVAPDFDPVSMEWLRKQAELIKSVTPERVQKAARTYLRPNKTWSASMLPTAAGD